MAKSLHEKKIDKIERTLVRLKHSLAADEELETRRIAREQALMRGEDYIIDVPQLLSGDDQE